MLRLVAATLLIALLAAGCIVEPGPATAPPDRPTSLVLDFTLKDTSGGTRPREASPGPHCATAKWHPAGISVRQDAMDATGTSRPLLVVIPVLEGAWATAGEASYAIATPWAVETGIPAEDAKVGRVEWVGDKYEGHASVNGEPVRVPFHWKVIDEADQWRVDAVLRVGPQTIQAFESWPCEEPAGIDGFLRTGGRSHTDMVQRIVSPTTGWSPRIPPGQHEVKNFPVLDLGIHPKFDPDGWRLKVWGAVENPFELKEKEFSEMPHVDLVADFHCVTRWSQLGLEWSGVPMSAIIRRARPNPEAKAVIAHGMEGYTTNVLLEDLGADDVILADRLAGRPVPTEHGGPVRLLVPQLYAWKSCKFLVGLEFLTENAPGFWEQRGYHLRGDPRDEERFW